MIFDIQYLRVQLPSIVHSPPFILPFTSSFTQNTINESGSDIYFFGGAGRRHSPEAGKRILLNTSN